MFSRATMLNGACAAPAASLLGGLSRGPVAAKASHSLVIQLVLLPNIPLRLCLADESLKIVEALVVREHTSLCMHMSVAEVDRVWGKGHRMGKSRDRISKQHTHHQRQPSWFSCNGLTFVRSEGGRSRLGEAQIRTAN
eukprot:1150984-Pelagomonas_calceolata.AAC.1